MGQDLVWTEKYDLLNSKKKLRVITTNLLDDNLKFCCVAILNIFKSSNELLGKFLYKTQYT